MEYDIRKRLKYTRDVWEGQNQFIFIKCIAGKYKAKMEMIISMIPS